MLPQSLRRIESPGVVRLLALWSYHELGLHVLAPREVARPAYATLVFEDTLAKSFSLGWV